MKEDGKLKEERIYVNYGCIVKCDGKAICQDPTFIPVALFRSILIR